MKKYAIFVIYALWGSASSVLAECIGEWGNATTNKLIILAATASMLMTISLMMVQKYRPEGLLNPYMAGNKTKAFFAEKPMLGGLITMLVMVAITTGIMLAIR